MEKIASIIKGIKEKGCMAIYFPFPYRIKDLIIAYKYAISLGLVSDRGNLTDLGNMFYDKSNLKYHKGDSYLLWNICTDTLWDIYVLCQHCNMYNVNEEK